VELFEKIRREYSEGVGTILGVAKKLGVHRRMVREAIQRAIPPKRKKGQRETTRLLSEVLLFIHQILMADQQAPRKQRHTAQRIYQRLRNEMPQQEVSPRSVRRAGAGLETTAPAGTRRDLHQSTVRSWPRSTGGLV
jgi:hypothetical protein